jgi:hypothetical protein
MKRRQIEVISSERTLMEVDIEQFLKLYSSPLDFQNFLSEHWRPRVDSK